MKKLFKFALLTIGFIGLIFVVYLWHLSAEIEKQFSGRRWSIPSRVFSDTTLLYPGQRIKRKLIQEKLGRLGYQRVSHSPERKGELRLRASAIEIFLQDLRVPNRQRKGFPLRIEFSRDQIISMTRTDTDEPVTMLELEPEEIAMFFGPEREERRIVSIDQIPQHVINAVLAAEDSRFYNHTGMDPRAILRALYANLRYRSIVQGGSTITQQLAKNYFLAPERTISRKLQELFISLVMELMYEKREILEIYLNEIYLGQKESVSVNGIGEASFFYFGKPVNELSLAEAATISGLIRAPNYYSPYVDKERSKKRRDMVLLNMHKQGWISQLELRLALDSSINPKGYKTYGEKAPYFIDYLSNQLQTLYSFEDLSSLGLSIYTTLDTQVQMAAEAALRRGLARLEKSNPDLYQSDPNKKLQGAFIAMQPKTGYILAMVGGRDYSVSQFNRVTQALRQPGSAFKPFVFLTGLDDFTPASMLSNEFKSYRLDGKLWEPRNYKPITDNPISMRNALAKSVNLATVDLAMKVGVDRILSTASAFHFSKPLQSYPSVSLGASEVIPLELARAYCVFAADGFLPFPLSIKEVADDGSKILERRHMSIEPVISPAKAFIMSSMLRSAVTEGTASSLKKFGISFPSAGKTGTTNGFRDAWFVGYTPTILALVWVGFDDGTSINATGSAAALPIWADFMNAIPQYITGAWFKVPPGVVTKRICLESGKLAVKYGCPRTLEEFFLTGHEPTELCPLHNTLNPIEQIINEVKSIITNF